MPTSGSSTGRARRLGSLRLRLAAWNALAVAATALVTLAVLRQGVMWALLHEADKVLAEDISEIELALRDTPRGEFDSVLGELERKAAGHQHHGWFVELRDSAGRILWASRATSAAEPGDDRSVVREIAANPHGVASVLVGEELRLLRSEVARIDRLALLTGGLMLLGAPLGAWLLAGRATTAIGDITRTARRLRPDHLDERLPVRGTGDELDRLASTINGLLDRIAVVLDHRRDVLANAAHELRTPLAAIRSCVEVALNSDRSAAEYRELLDDVIDQCGSLQILLNQLLLISETENERLKTQVEPVDFAALVVKSAAMFQGVAESRGVSLDVEGTAPATVAGQREHLWQVVNNLLDNAIKYTPEGGRIRIVLTSDKAAGQAELIVEDTGVGIASVDLPHVFDRFFRADRARTRGAAVGSGLGLSICQSVVAAHGGDIRCESQPGHGTRMIVRLPLVAAHSESGLIAAAGA
ncbi:MAG: HAMP domain-containing protein [Planctomyces sp.]|nr:HAMP domain-containing protein [Planctomyces sp.]